MSTVRALRDSLVAASRRYSRVAAEVEDLAHDVLLSALRRGELDGDGAPLRVHGAARRHAAFLARSAARRRARETDAATSAAGIPPEADAPPGAPVSVLPQALRTTLLLLLAGLEKAELRYALGLSDAALRKRFQALRAHAPLERPVTQEPLPPAPALRRSQVELLPQLAGTVQTGAARVLATRDPDGHGIIFTEVLTSAGRTATPCEVSPESPRAATKGRAC